MKGIPEKADDVIAWITIRMHSHGALSVSGTIGDRRMALALIDEGRAAISRQLPEDRAIIVPNRDVTVPTVPTLREMGDLAPHERGDS